MASSSHDALVAWESERHMNLIASTVIGSVPKSPSIFLHLLKIFEALDRDSRFYKEQAWKVTGPLLFTEIFANRTYWTKNSAVLPSRTFYPVHWADLDHWSISEGLQLTYSRCKHSFTFHNWQGTSRSEFSALQKMILILCAISLVVAIYDWLKKRKFIK